MTAPDISVTYERKFSDGNYGSEGLSFSVTIPVEHEELRFDVLTAYAHNLRREVLAELAKSEAPRVAGAAKRELNPPAPPPAAPPMSDEAYFDAMADARSY